MEIRKKAVSLHQKQQNQSNMNNERTISVSEKKVTFFVSWESKPNNRKYSRAFTSIEDVAKFICKHPEREYQRIYESENWYEEIENFMGFSGIHLVSCGNVVREFKREDFIQ